MSDVKRYLKGYETALQQQIETMLETQKTGDYLLSKYPDAHQLSSEKQLYEYTQALKQTYMRSSAPISKVVYDDKIHVIHNALGLHSFVSRVQGSKLKAKHEIRVAAMFRRVPEPMLRMILVHELAHLREKEHNRAFYKLCRHLEPAYHQLEFDLRVYLCHKEQFGTLWG